MNRIGTYHIRPFSQFRRNITLVVHEGWRKHTAHEILELDVTNGRDKIRSYKKQNGIPLSFTGWIIKCAAQALFEHKHLNAYRRGKKIYYFDDVDVPIPIERIIEGEEIPMVYIIRKVTEKTLEEISIEIKNAISRTPKGRKQLLGKEFTFLERFALSSPMILKKLLVKIVRNRPLLKKKYMGTLGVTAVGMKGRVPGWIIPMGGTTTILIVVGGIMKKPRVLNDEIKIRDILHLTITIDHDLIDGGPLARFTDRFIELVEQGFSIPNVGN
jgi:pyruvate/2-oxoglutarate dehydrogenase complex dihydrolipoamide acyltransferase (E2) component